MGALVPLYNPRRDAWDDHFALDDRTFEIVGLTPVGRATASQLRMNRVQARQRTQDVAPRSCWGTSFAAFLDVP
jgi:hypothetical protein